MKFPLVCSATLALLGLFAARQAVPEKSSVVLGSWKAFSFETLAAESASKNITYLPFLDRPTLSAGIYRLRKGATDLQKPHRLDEVYHVVKGRAKLEVAGETTAVGPGSIVFVAAGTEHRFVEIEEALEVLVLFSLVPPQEDEAQAGAAEDR